VCRKHTLLGWGVTGRNDNDGARAWCTAQMLIQPRTHFTSAFANERNHNGVDIGVSSQRTQQGALARGWWRHDTDTLAMAQQERTINGPQTRD